MADQADAPQYLTLYALQTAAERYSYKPGWKFEVYNDPFEGPYLYIHMILEDSYNPGNMLPLYVRSNIPPVRTLEEFQEYLQWRLIQIEIHEAREWFKRDDSEKPVYDPHDPYEPAKNLDK